MTQPQLRIVDESGKRQPLRFRFTVRDIGKLPPPTRGRVYVYDTVTPGLAIQLTPAGHAAYYFVRKFAGRKVRVKLGDVQDISLENVRKLAATHAATMAQGKDPAQAKRDARDEYTLGEVQAVYHSEHALIRSAPATIVSEESLWNAALKSLHNRKLSHITAGDVARLHGKLATERGKRTANRGIQYIRRLYRFAKKRQLHTGDIPTDHVDLFSEQSRERFLSAEELPRFLAAVDEEPQPFRDWFRLALFTGARSGNVRAMRWECIDLDKGVWIVPADESKNERPMTVHLAAEARDILKTRRALAEPEAVYVFPVCRDKGVRSYIGQPHRAFARVCERAGIKGLRIHDLRRSMGAMLAIGGASLPVVGAALGHRDYRATQIYARLSDSPVAAAVESAVATMTAKPKTKRGTKAAR